MAAQASLVPSQIRTAYGINGITFGSTTATGAGTTIAIIDAYKDATITTDVASFDTTYGLTTFNTGGPTFTVVGQTLSTTSLPGAPSSFDKADSDGETALDVEWAHSIAPGANIMLVEANSLGSSDLVTAINNAKAAAGVSVISMSFGGSESSNETSTTYSASTLNDNTFQQAGGHTGVTFLAATGDSGTQSSPATSPYVVAVGGTSLTLNANNTRQSETVWNGSTGAGVSAYETKPTYQTVAAAAFAKRVIPDVSYDADPVTGFNVYTEGALQSYYGGTSIAAPQWAGLIALANQGRAANGLTALTSTQALTMLYALYGTPYYSQAFYDVTSGNSNGYSAGTGFDAASGLGVPNANFIVPYLAGSISITPEPMTLGLIGLSFAGLAARRRRV